MLGQYSQTHCPPPQDRLRPNLSRLSLAEAAQRRVQDHGRVVGGHPVGHCVKCLLEVLDDLAVPDQLRGLQRISNDLGQLAGCHLLVARAIGSRVCQPDGTPDQLDA